MNEYVDAKQLHEQTRISYRECLKIINQAREIMRERGCYIPVTRPRLAKTKIVKEILK